MVNQRRITLSLSPETYEYLKGTDNASRLVDRLVKKAMDEQPDNPAGSIYDNDLDSIVKKVINEKVEKLTAEKIEQLVGEKVKTSNSSQPQIQQVEKTNSSTVNDDVKKDVMIEKIVDERIKALISSQPQPLEKTNGTDVNRGMKEDEKIEKLINEKLKALNTSQPQPQSVEKTKREEKSKTFNFSRSQPKTVEQTSSININDDVKRAVSYFDFD